VASKDVLFGLMLDRLGNSEMDGKGNGNAEEFARGSES